MCSQRALVPSLLQELRYQCSRLRTSVLSEQLAGRARPVDHVRRCPDDACTPQSAQNLTADLGLVAGNRQKHIVADAVTGRLDVAEPNASRHNTPECQALRERLDSTDFAPWTDMPSAIEALR